MTWRTCIGRLGSVGFQDTSRNKMRIPVTSCLADWAFSSLPWRGILLDMPVRVRKYITAVSWKVAHTPQLTERGTYKHLLFCSLPWDKIPLILLWCFHSSKTGQWQHQQLHCCKSWKENRPVYFLFLFFCSIWGKRGQANLERGSFTWLFAPSKKRGALEVKAGVHLLIFLTAASAPRPPICDSEWLFNSVSYLQVCWHLGLQSCQMQPKSTTTIDC